MANSLLSCFILSRYVGSLVIVNLLTMNDLNADTELSAQCSIPNEVQLTVTATTPSGPGVFSLPDRPPAPHRPTSHTSPTPPPCTHSPPPRTPTSSASFSTPTTSIPMMRGCLTVIGGKRIAEMRAQEKKGRFGTVMPLGREDFVREVTEGSKEGGDGSEEEEEEEEEEEDESAGAGPSRLRGTGVVVFLYNDSCVDTFACNTDRVASLKLQDTSLATSATSSRPLSVQPHIHQIPSDPRGPLHPQLPRPQRPYLTHLPRR